MEAADTDKAKIQYYRLFPIINPVISATLVTSRCKGISYNSADMVIEITTRVISSYILTLFALALV